jgi:hypothetical protein
MLPIFLRSNRSTIALIFGLLDTFYDEQAPLREVRQILHRVSDTVREITSRGVSLLLSCNEWNVHPPERNNLFLTLKAGMDRVYYLANTHDQRTRLYLEQTDLSGRQARNSIERK